MKNTSSRQIYFSVQLRSEIFQNDDFAGVDLRQMFVEKVKRRNGIVRNHRLSIDR